MTRRIAILLTAMVLGAATAVGADVMRPVASAWTIEFGTAHLTDSYLTPLHYNGTSATLRYERLQAMRFDPQRWTMRLQAALEYDRTRNTARNATMGAIALNASWAMMRRISLPWGLRLAAGGAVDLDVGALYLARNGNNPVSARFALTLDLTADLWRDFRIGRLPVTLRWQPTLPVIGAFFSPDYGELYYEIYLGNDHGLAHCAWWGSRFVLDNLVTADLRLGSTSLRLGYRGHIMNSRAGGIVCRRYVHAFVLGVSGEWLSVPRNGLSPQARIISATY